MHKKRAVERLVRLLAAVGPFARETKPRPHVATAPEQPPPKVKVLLVDDDDVNQMLVAAMLSQWGIDTVLAGDGAAAVARAREQPLDLIVMDLQMPVLDGIGATRQIRRFEREQALPRTPVVAYTSSDVSRHAMSDAGIDDVLRKPCDRDELARCLQRWCAPVKEIAAVPAGRPIRAS